jgi:hypothetical protein
MMLLFKEKRKERKGMMPNQVLCISILDSFRVGVCVGTKAREQNNWNGAASCSLWA